MEKKVAHNQTSEKKAAASRANGAKSRGPKTAEGKAKSSLNAITHGGYSKRPTHLLPWESDEAFKAFSASFHDLFQPANDVEASLVDEMVFARWRMDRFCALQDQTLSLKVRDLENYFNLKYDSISEPERLSVAVSNLVASSPALDFLYRVEARLRRQYSRAQSDLLKLQKLRRDAKNGETNLPDQQPQPAQLLPATPQPQNPCSSVSIRVPNPVPANQNTSPVTGPVSPPRPSSTLGPQ